MERQECRKDLRIEKKFTRDIKGGCPLNDAPNENEETISGHKGENVLSGSGCDGGGGAAAAAAHQEVDKRQVDGEGAAFTKGETRVGVSADTLNEIDAKVQV